MDLNKLELPAFTIAELYRSCLVLPIDKGKNDQPQTQPELPGPKYLGNNKKNILIVVRHTDAVHLPDKELELLTGILTACKLGLEDVAIVNTVNYPGQGYKELTGQFRSTKVFLFGIEPAGFGLPLSFPNFQTQHFSQVIYMGAPTLHQISSDREIKTALWNSLKKIFDL